MRQYIFSVFNEIFNKQIDQSGIPYSVDPAQLAESTQHLLSAYVEAKLDGRDAAALFPDVHQALAQYQAFAEEYETLYDLLDAERKGELEEPPSVPTFDFSYLDLPTPTKEFVHKNPLAVASIIDEAGRLVIRFSTELMEVLQAETRTHQRLQAAAVSGLKSMDTWQTWLIYSPTNSPEDLAVDMTFKHIGDENEYCNVIMKVDVPSRRGWPNLAHSQVQLRTQDGKSELGTTDVFGEVVFEGIKKSDVPQLTFEIDPVGG